MTHEARFRFIATLFVVALVTFLVPQALALDAIVNCPNGDGGTYPSINAALADVGPSGGGTITVTGTCQESVALWNLTNIVIQASAPGAAKVDGTPYDAFNIFHSTVINLVDLDIRGGNGVAAISHTQASITSCNIHDSGADGIAGVYVNNHTDVVIRHSTIQNNPGYALYVSNYSSASVTGSTLQGNGSGVYAQNYARVGFTNQNSIVNNADYGLYAIDFSRLSFNSSDPALFSTIQGHTTNGISVARQSILVMSGPHVIQGNGSSCGPPDCGGISGVRNATIRLTSTIISGNQGAGISLHQGVDMGLMSTTITNNSGDGVRLAQISIGDFLVVDGYPNNIITGNGGASVYCDKTSLATGNLTGIRKPKCDNIDGSDGHDHGHGGHDHDRD
ncbi:MAG: right-handed parallel beta-helix repeat-containing protein [Terriglobales bacterium]